MNNNENFIEFFMHLQLQTSLLKVIYNWLLDTLYITLHMDMSLYITPHMDIII
jgi:hypothetical protein